MKAFQRNGRLWMAFFWLVIGFLTLVYFVRS